MTDQFDNLTHMNEEGSPRMVDVGDKDVTERRAIAEARVKINEALATAITANDVAKGSVLDVARLAGILAAKRTDELIPLCHSLPLDHVDVNARLHDGTIYLRAEARTTSKTGVEMEALTAASIAALTVIDMGKALDPGMVVEHVRLVEKTGGRSGDVRPHKSEFPE